MASSPDDLIWVAEAAVKFKRSRDWIDAQIKSGNLNRYTINGDRRAYISESELKELLKPKRDF